MDLNLDDFLDRTSCPGMLSFWVSLTQRGFPGGMGMNVEVLVPWVAGWEASPRPTDREVL